jgi:acyl-CoA dehydrogenase
MLMINADVDLRVSVKADDHEDICDTVRKICAEFPGNYWRELEDLPVGQRYPSDFVGALSEAGILGALVPEANGGIGLPIAAGAAIVETIHASGCNAAIPINQFVFTQILANFAPEGGAELLGQIAEGQKTAFSIAHGSLHGAPIGAETVDGRTTLTGSGARVVAPSHSDYMLVVGTERAGMGLFLLDVAAAREEGSLRIEPAQELTASNAEDVHFDQCHVRQDTAIVDANDANRALAFAEVVRRILDAAAAVGDGRFFSRRGAQYANERIVFGHPIGTYQGIQFPLARAHIEVEAAAIGLRKAIALFDAGKDASVAASVARHLGVEAAWNMADAAFTTHGGFAFAREYDIERKWRDARAVKLSRLPGEGDLKMIGASGLGFSQLEES